MQNGTLTMLLQKWTRKMIIFHLFGSVPEGKNATTFICLFVSASLPRNVQHLFVCLLALHFQETYNICLFVSASLPRNVHRRLPFNSP
jgi:hypothetical protein